MKIFLLLHRRHSHPPTLGHRWLFWLRKGERRLGERQRCLEMNLNLLKNRVLPGASHLPCEPVQVPSLLKNAFHHPHLLRHEFNAPGTSLPTVGQRSLGSRRRTSRVFRLLILLATPTTLVAPVDLVAPVALTVPVTFTVGIAREVWSSFARVATSFLV